MSPRKPKIRENIAAVVEDYKTQTLRTIAIRYGCSYETVRRILLAEGVKVRSKGENPPGAKRSMSNELPERYTEGDVVNALLKGTEPLAVAKFLKVRKGLIEKIAKRNGLVRMRGEWGRA